MRKPPIVSGQCAEALEPFRVNQPALSFLPTSDYAMPETATRAHDLLAIGFNIDNGKSQSMVVQYPAKEVT